MSTTTAFPADPEPSPPTNRPSPESTDVIAYAEAQENLRSLALKVGVISTALAVATLADVFLAIPAFNGVLGESEILSFFCAVAFVVIAVGSALTGGREWRHGNRAASYAAAAAVLLLIAGLMVLRITAAGINSSSVAFEGAIATEDGALTEVPIAVVFATLMLATSILAALDGYHLTVPKKVKALRALSSAERAAAGEIVRKEAEQTRLIEDLGAAEGKVERIDEELDIALRSNQALARELQELARTEIARHLGSPTATSNLDLPLSRPATITITD